MLRSGAISPNISMVPIIPYICFHIRSYFVLFVWFQMKTHKQRITYMYIVIYVHIEFEYEQMYTYIMQLT